MSTEPPRPASREIGLNDKNDSLPKTFSTPAHRGSLGKRVMVVILPLKTCRRGTVGQLTCNGPIRSPAAIAPSVPAVI